MTDKYRFTDKNGTDLNVGDYYYMVIGTDIFRKFRVQANHRKEQFIDEYHRFATKKAAKEYVQSCK